MLEVIFMSEENTKEVEQSTEKKTEPTLDKNEVISDFLKSKDFIDMINAEKGKAIESFQKDKLPTLVEKEIEARNHKEPWQIELEQMRNKVTAMEQEKAKEVEARIRGEHKAKALKVFSEKNLPTDLVDFLVSTDEEATNSNIEKAISVFEDFKATFKQDALKSNNTKVPGEVSTAPKGSIPEPGPEATKEEWKAYWKQTK
jgi:hypothetical protein